MRYLADSTLLVDYFRRRDEAREYIEKARRGEITLFISAVTEAELWVGIRTDSQLESYVALLEEIKKIHVNSKIAREAGSIWKQYSHYMGRDSERSPEEDLRHLPDALIAATAKSRNLILLTANYKHFRQLEANGLIGLELYLQDSQ